MVSEPVSCLYTNDLQAQYLLLMSQNFKINLSYATGKITLATWIGLRTEQLSALQDCSHLKSI